MLKANKERKEAEKKAEREQFRKSHRGLTRAGMPHGGGFGRL